MMIQWMFKFMAMVWRMRRHQDAWFRLHKQSDLIEAKQLERQVDCLLSKHLLVVNDEPVRVVGLGDVDVKQEKLI